MIDVLIVIVIRMQNHKYNEMENAFQIFKVSCLVRVTQIHITMVNDLRALRRDDVTLPRDVRKTIFSHRLWLPKFQRLHAERKHRLFL